MQYPSGYWLASHRVMWLHVVGPGRVAIQSAYEQVEDEGGAISSYSNLLGGYGVATLGAATPTIAPVRPQPQAPHAPIHIDPRHQLLVGKVEEVMVNGEVPPHAMDALMHFAAQQGLSAYDVRLIIKYVQSHGT